MPRLRSQSPGTNFRAGVTASIGTAPLGGVVLVSATELHAVVPPGIAPGVYTLRVRNLGDPEPARLPDSYTVLAAGAEDFWAAAEDLWTDPQTVHAGAAVQLSLNVHRHTGEGAGFAPRTVEVRFYRQLGPAQDGGGDTNQLAEIGRATTVPVAVGDGVASVTVSWSTAGLAGHGNHRGRHRPGKPGRRSDQEQQPRHPYSDLAAAPRRRQPADHHEPGPERRPSRGDRRDRHA